LALGRMKDPHTVALLITALQDADKRVRGGTIRALGEIKDPGAVESLIAALQDTDKGVREDSARALGEIGDPHAVEPLIAMQRDADRGIRRVVVEALTRIGDPRTVELLREIDPLELLEIPKPTLMYRIDPELPRTYHPPSSPSPTDQDRLQFSAFYPRVAIAGEWHTLFVYAHITSALKAVRRDADKFRDALGLIHGEVNAQTKEPILKGTKITIVPSCQKVTFNPDRFSFRWLEDWQQIKFRFMPEEELAGSASNGEISVYVGPLIVATLKIAFLFETKEQNVISGVKDDVGKVTSYVYQRIFASYNHDDSSVVLACRNVSKILGNEYLIDIDKLRTGQYWNPAILKMIDDADIFQLFWSERAAQSQYVTQEW